MQQSVLLCISTILDSGNRMPCLLTPSQRLLLTVRRVHFADYTKMMELVDDFGNTVFETIKITLVCGTWYLRTIVFW